MEAIFKFSIIADINRNISKYRLQFLISVVIFAFGVLMPLNTVNLDDEKSYGSSLQDICRSRST
jgi:hypothetical protein